MPKSYANMHVKLSSLPTGHFALHRGGAHIAPENTIQAVELCVSMGIKMVEIDLYGTFDGDAMVMHDSRTDRTTSVDLSSNHVSCLIKGGAVVDPKKARPGCGDGWREESVPMFSDFLYRFKGICCFIAELKNDEAGNSAADMAKLYGMRESVIVHTQGMENIGRLSPSIAQGMQTMIAPGVELDQSSANDIAAQGVAWVSLGGASASVSSVQAAKAAGLKVSIALPTYRYDYENRQTMYSNEGIVIDQWLTDEPMYLSGTKHVSTNDPWGIGTFYHGHLAPKGDRGKFVMGSSAYEFHFPSNYNSNTGEAGEDQLLLGWACPLKESENTDAFVFDFKFNPTQTSSFPRLIVPICHSTDKPWNEWDTGTDVDGYMLYINGNGDLRIYRHDADSLTELATASATGFTTDDHIHMRVTVTSTTIRWERVDDGIAAEATDSIYRGSYLWLGTREMTARFYNLSVS